MFKRPALVYRHLSRFFAWNEDGRLICWRWTYEEIAARLTALGYEIVPANSRTAALIRERLAERVPSMENETTPLHL